MIHRSSRNRILRTDPKSGRIGSHVTPGFSPGRLFTMLVYLGATSCDTLAHCGGPRRGTLPPGSGERAQPFRVPPLLHPVLRCGVVTVRGVQESSYVDPSRTGEELQGGGSGLPRPLLFNCVFRSEVFSRYLLVSWFTPRLCDVWLPCALRCGPFTKSYGKPVWVGGEASHRFCGRTLEYQQLLSISHHGYMWSVFCGLRRRQHLDPQRCSSSCSRFFGSMGKSIASTGAISDRGVPRRS